MNEELTRVQRFAKKRNTNKLTPKTTIGLMVGVLFFGIFIFFAITMTNQSIRAQQINELVAPENTSDKLELIPYGTLEQFIQEKPAVSILFGAPTAKQATTVLTLIKQKENELNRKIYWYPVVYDTTGLENTYKIDPHEMTFLFFQNGQEKKRVLTSALSDLNQELIPEINRLPMWNLTDQKKD